MELNLTEQDTFYSIPKGWYMVFPRCTLNLQQVLPVKPALSSPTTSLRKLWTSYSKDQQHLKLFKPALSLPDTAEAQQFPIQDWPTPGHIPEATTGQGRGEDKHLSSAGPRAG